MTQQFNNHRFSADETGVYMIEFSGDDGVVTDQTKFVRWDTVEAGAAKLREERDEAVAQLSAVRQSYADHFGDLWAAEAIAEQAIELCHQLWLYAAVLAEVDYLATDGVRAEVDHTVALARLLEHGGTPYRSGS